MRTTPRPAVGRVRLEEEQLKVLLERVAGADHRTFRSVTKHLFDYLEKACTENPAFLRLERGRAKWTDWPSGPEGSFGVDWSLPEDGEEAKSLAYDLYRTIADVPNAATGLPFNLFRHTNFNENIEDFNRTFGSFFLNAIDDILTSANHVGGEDPMSNEGRKVFVIHGHDEAMKTSVQLLLNRAGLDDVVLHEQDDRGRNVVDKLIEESVGARYAVALLSPDDELADGTSRARQNVILEIGYFLGKLGKQKVRLLKRGDVEIPSDLAGILYETYDQGGAWRMRLLKEMRAVGIEIDIDAVMRKL